MMMTTTIMIIKWRRQRQWRWWWRPSLWWRHFKMHFHEGNFINRLVTTATATATATIATTATVAADDDTITITHYNDAIMGAMASQITSLTIVYSTVYSSADQRTHQSSTSLAFVRGIHRWPVNSPHKWPVTLKMFPFDEVIMHHRNCDHFHYYSTCDDIDFPSYLLCRK